jgi:WD40 repeat protein
MDGFRYHVFLSHASSDKPAVEELALWLMREGLTPFLDEWDLVPGEDWTDALTEALAASRTCAVVIGPGDKGGWQTEEVKQSLLRRVRERNREAGDRFRIIPVLLPGASAPGADEPSAFDFLAEYTWVKFDKTLDEEGPRHRLACGIKGVPPGRGPGVAVVAGEYPYRGLEVFDVKHANLFFGREKLTRDLVEMLGAILRGPGPRLLAVVGPSGCGKSSLVRAGLIPVLKQGALEGNETWRWVIFKPGGDPFESLGIGLTALPGGAGLLAETRQFLGINRFGRDHDRSLHTAARLATREHPPPARLLVVADQFEQVFTQCAQEDDRRSLITNLLEAATVADGPVVVVLSLRADFLGKCAASRALADALSGRQKLVGAMSEDELRWAIEKPAALAGGEIESGLVDQLLHDVGSDPGTLPLLEFALSRLWSQKTGRRMTAEDYQAIGGLRGALNQHADAVIDGLREGGLEDVARRVFLDLIEPGKGTEDTRRRIAKARVAASAEWAEVVETLVRERLVTTDRPDDARGDTIELVHESLIRNWATLQGWVDADRKSIEARSEIQAAADRWVDHERHPDYLLDGLPLANALEWAKTQADDLARLAPVGEFLAESDAAERRRRDDELRRRDDELEKERRHGRRVGVLAIVVSVLAIVSVGLGILADTARKTAEKERDAKGKALTEAVEARAREKSQRLIADSRRLAVLSALERDHHLDTALLLAVEAVQAEETLEARQCLFDGLQSQPRLKSFLYRQHGMTSHVCFSSDGRMWAAIGRAHGHLITTQDINLSCYGLTVSSDGRLIAYARRGYFELWDTAKQERLAEENRIPSTGADWYLSSGAILSIAFNPSGDTLAIGYHDVPSFKKETGGVLLWDVSQHQFLTGIKLPEIQSGVGGLSFRPGGKALAGYVASGDREGDLILWDLNGRKVPDDGRLHLTEGPVRSLAFSPEGKVLAAGYSADGERGGGVVLLDVDKRTKVVDGHIAVAGPVTEVKFVPNSKKLAIRYIYTAVDPPGGMGPQLIKPKGRTAVVLWDWDSHKVLRDEPIPQLRVDRTFAAFTPDCQTLVVGYEDGAVVMWDLVVHNRLKDTLDLKGRFLATSSQGRIYSHGRLSRSLAYSPDGTILAVVDSDGVMLWDVAGRKRAIDGHLSVPQGPIDCLAFSPDGKTLAAGLSVPQPGYEVRDGVVIWDIADRTHVFMSEPIKTKGPVFGVAFSPDGKTFAAEYYFGALLWDLEDHRLLWDSTFRRTDKGRSQHIITTYCYGVAFSPDPSGKTLRIIDKSGIGFLDVASRKPLLDSRFEVPECAAFSPDGQTLAAVVEGGVVLWDIGSRKKVADLIPGICNKAAFIRDGKILAVGGPRDIVFWDVSSHGRLTSMEIPGGVGDMAFSPDANTVAILPSDERSELSVSLWDVGLKSWQDLAGKIANRNFTREEWREYFHDEQRYRQTFPHLPDPDEDESWLVPRLEAASVREGTFKR